MIKQFSFYLLNRQYNVSCNTSKSTIFGVRIGDEAVDTVKLLIVKVNQTGSTCNSRWRISKKMFVYFIFNGNFDIYCRLNKATVDVFTLNYH